jgi:hypothetical protein
VSFSEGKRPRFNSIACGKSNIKYFVNFLSLDITFTLDIFQMIIADSISTLSFVAVECSVLEA